MISCDTGPLVAAAVSEDVHHDRCVRILSELHVRRRALVVPPTVVAEAGYLIGRSLERRPRLAS